MLGKESEGAREMGDGEGKGIRGSKLEIRRKRPHSYEYLTEYGVVVSQIA